MTKRAPTTHSPLPDNKFPVAQKPSLSKESPISPESPVLHIDLSSAVPAYRQIVDGLRALLVAGAFRPTDKLPTVRQMAIDLNVNHNTVAEAYRLLAAEGWLKLKRRNGATVIPRPPRNADPTRHQDFARRLHELAARAIADGVDNETLAGQLNILADRLKLMKKGTL